MRLSKSAILILGFISLTFLTDFTYGQSKWTDALYYYNKEPMGEWVRDGVFKAFFDISWDTKNKCY